MRCAQPAVMVPTPQTSFDSGVFGHAFSLPSQTRARTRAARTAARLDVRFLSRPAGSARLVRILELRRRHAHLRLRSPRVALRRRRLRLGQLRARHRPVAVAVLPAHRPRRCVPLRRSHDAPHRRSRRASPREIRAAGLAPQRHALGLLGQATAHQHGVESPLLLLPHRRRARRRSHARADRSGAHAAHRAADSQTAGRASAPGRRSERRFRAPGFRHRLGLDRRRLAHRMGAHARSENARPAASRA